MDLTDLGLTQEELRELVIARLTKEILNSNSCDEDGDYCMTDSQFKKEIFERVKLVVKESIDRVANASVLPNVGQYINDLTLQETNRWGEKKAEPLTFVEYLVQRANAYLEEKVDFEGKSKDSNSYGSWSGRQTRIAHLVNKHLHYSIETAMKQAVDGANKTIVGGLAEAMKIALKNISETLTVTVKTKTP